MLVPVQPWECEQGLFYRYLGRTESSLEDKPFEVENTVPLFDKRKSENLAERVSPDVNMCKYLLDLCQISFHVQF